MLKGILGILWSAKDETRPTGSKHIIFSGYNEYTPKCKTKLSDFVHIHEKQKMLPCNCRIACQKYEYYAEYFTHKVKYFFTYLNKFE